MAFRKDDITYHHTSWYGGGRVPAINVKVHNFGGRDAVDKLMAEYGVTEAQAERALEIVFEAHQRDFWDYLAPEAVEEIINPAFNGNFDAYSEGRSGGWLVVDGKRHDGRITRHFDGVESWDAIKVSAWGRFVKRIEAEVAYLTSYDEIVATIDANEYLVRLADRAARIEVDFAD